MKFNTTSVWAAFLVVLSLSVVNAIPVDQAEIAALSADELLTRGDGTFAIPEDAKVEEVPEASKKVSGCGFRSFFTYHSCL
ncbi:hypothetical protein BGZ70_010087 [Mortierella alpina]|uniref:Uncharacterized protein n=1 Tax=Mortierella alpina TaxID=64518 RepID=A0A9P6J044_MORAP|nr:hypothetical protein BGZ70_010087 [Mortierella alpina]